MTYVTSNRSNSWHCGILLFVTLLLAACPWRTADAVDIAAGSSHACAITSSGGVMCWGSNGSGQLGDGTGTPNIPLAPVAVINLSGPVTALAAGRGHTCALTRAGAVQCWGDNSSGQLGNGDTSGAQQNSPVAVSGLGSGVVAITASSEGLDTCALKSSGAMLCWGTNTEGELGNGDSSGATQYSPVPVSGLGSGVAAISAGDRHTCAATSAGAAKCWGSGFNGALGDGDTSGHNAYAPVQVSGLTSGVASISASPGNYEHTCALTTAGAVKCWGTNDYGQLGNGTMGAPSGTPVQVGGLTSGVTMLATGGAGVGYYGYTCALNAGGVMKCWGGAVGSPVIGNGYGMAVDTPTAVLGLAQPVTEMALGSDFGCALDASGHVQCWGDENFGEFGDATSWSNTGIGPFYRSYVPVGVLGLASGSAKVAVGAQQNACSLSATGAAQCWGANGYMLGNGDDGTGQAAPSPVVGLGAGVSAISAGGPVVCAIAGGAAKCWGLGELGDGINTYSNTPVSVSGLTSGVTAIATGGGHQCAVANGAAKCWGANYYGELGNGDTSGVVQPTPVPVSGLGSGVATVVAGQFHACALTTGGAVKCWGYNADGELGNGDTTGATQYMPVQVSGLTSGVVAIAAGGEVTCALTSAGAAKCWGNNGFGQLGNGDTTTQFAPVQVSGLSSGTTAITTSGFHSCALRTSGAMLCWGDNSWGELGTGDTATHITPIGVSGLSAGVSAISVGGAGPSNTCAVTSAGATLCWGNNGSGQLGIGHGPSVTYPDFAVTGTPFGILSVTSITPPANNTYSLPDGNNTLTFTAHMSDVATVIGTPRIAITLASGTVYANYSGGSGTTSLTFTYTVAVGDFDSNGIALNSPIDLNGGYIHAGAVYSAGTFTPPNTSGVLVDGAPPTVTSSVPAGSNPTVAASIDYTVAFSEAVTGVTASDFSLTATGGITGASVGTISGSGTSRTVSVNTGSGSGTLRLNAVANQTLTDLHANPMLVGYTAGTPYTINRATTTTLTSAPNPSLIGQSVSATWIVTPAVGGGTFGGTVGVAASTGESCSGAVGAGGTASCTLSFANAGSRTLTATYAGGGSYAGSTSSAITQTVNKNATTTAVAAVTPSPVVVGQTYTVSGTVTVNAPGSGVPTGAVTVSDGSGAGSASTTCTLAGGAYSCALASISAGTKTLTASYGGDANDLGSTGGGTQQVNKDATTTSIASVTPDPAVVGQNYTVSGTVTVTAPGGGIPTGTITVTDGTGAGSASTTCSLAGGAYTCTLASTSVGAKTLTATYAGDANDLGSSHTGTQQINRSATATTISTVTPNPAVLGQSYTVSGSVAATPPGGGTPTGTMTVADGSGAGSASTTCPLASGAFTCTLTSISVGTKTLTATYPGDTNYSDSSGTHAQQINKDATTTTIASVTPNPVVLGQSYTVSGAVSVNSPGSGTPTGTVTVADGSGTGSASATCTLSAGAYTCTLTSISAGAKTLTATYSGDASDLTSTGTGTQQVNQGATTTTVVTVIPTPVVVGQSYTVSGNVTANPPSIGTPTGTVTVNDGTGAGSASTTCSLASGAYTCTLASISAGAKTLTATYAGDSNYLGSSGTGTQQVNGAGTLAIVPSGPAYARFGQSVTYMIQVSNSGESSVNSLVTDTLPSQFVSGSAAWTCSPAGGATCTSSGDGDLSDDATIPPGDSVTYLLTATVDIGANITDDEIIDTASAEDLSNHNIITGTVDTNLVLFRNGFEAGENGVQDGSPQLGLERSIGMGAPPLLIDVSAMQIAPRNLVVIARGFDGAREMLRIEAVRLDASNIWMRWVDGNGSVERSGPWSRSADDGLALALALSADGGHVIVAAWNDATQEVAVGATPIIEIRAADYP